MTTRTAGTGETSEEKITSIVTVGAVSARKTVRLRIDHVWIGVVLLGLGLLYKPTLGLLVQTWWTRDDYSHGFLIPLISGYMIWSRRERLRNLAHRPNLLWGIPLFLLAGAMLLGGRAGGVALLEEFSLIVILEGLILLALGTAHLRITFFPVAYLLFMLPVAEELVDPFQWPLRLLTAKMSVASLQALGFPALLEQQYIVLPQITLEVAQACSGASFLIALAAIGVPLAYLSLASWRNRFFLIFSGIAVGVISNWLRVILIGIGVFYGYPILHGPFHILHGLLVAQIGFVYLFAAAWLLSRTSAERSKKNRSVAQTIPFNTTEPVEHTVRMNRGWWTAFALLAGMLVLAASYDRGPVPLRERLETFPLSIEGWKGEPMAFNKALFRVQGADQELLRSYRSSSGQEIELYIAYFESQHEEKKIINYLINRLHRFATPAMIPVDPRRSISFNQGQFTDQGKDYRVSFCYIIDGRLFTSRFLAKAAMVRNALLEGRTNGAFVLVSQENKNDATDRGDEEAAFAAERAFVRSLFPVLGWYIP